jgi:hypothetical protein
VSEKTHDVANEHQQEEEDLLHRPQGAQTDLHQRNIQRDN